MAKRIDEVLRGRPLPPQPSAPPSPQNEVCPKCKGAGYICYDVPFGDPLFGRAFPCECLIARREERDLLELQEASDLVGELRTRSFANFDRNVKGLDEAYKAAWEYAQDPNGWLVLIGPVGCGKTHLAAALANHCLANGSRTLFVNVPDLLDHLRAAYTPTSTVSFDERLEEIQLVELLILDDLGTESSTDWAREKIYQIINRRYVTRTPTVVTMNPREFERLDERIKSRLMDAGLSRVIFIHAPSEKIWRPDPRDYRTRKARRPSRP